MEVEPDFNVGDRDGGDAAGHDWPIDGAAPASVPSHPSVPRLHFDGQRSPRSGGLTPNHALKPKFEWIRDGYQVCLPWKVASGQEQVDGVGSGWKILRNSVRVSTGLLHLLREASPRPQRDSQSPVSVPAGPGELQVGAVDGGTSPGSPQVSRAYEEMLKTSPITQRQLDSK